MSFIARVYKIMIGAPSDIKEEMQIAKEVIHEWNYINTERNHKVLLPLHWSISTYPSSGKHPQKLINEQIVDKSDLLICIFGSRLGSPTDTDISGSVEEINEHLKAGKDVMIFFRRNLNISSINDLQQTTKLLEFKENIKGKVLFEEYNDEKEFKPLLTNKLQLFLNDNWLNPNYKAKETENEKVDLSLDKTEVNILCSATDYISVHGIRLDECDYKIEDEYFAYPYHQNGKIEINSRKVGRTKLIVAYGKSIVECTVNIIPMNNFCGSPLLNFGESAEFISYLCNKTTQKMKNEEGFYCHDDHITHYYFFENDKLSIVVSHVKVQNNKFHSLEAMNCMRERYNHMNGGNGNTHWYQYKNDFFVASMEDRQNKDWYFFYSPSKEKIDEKLNLFE